IADQAIHQSYFGAECFRLDEIRGRHISRHEHIGIDSRGSSIRGQCSTCISGGWDGDFPDSKLAAHRDGAGYATGLECCRRVNTFVFEPDVVAFHTLSKALEAMQGGETFLQRNNIVWIANRQQWRAPSHGSR